MHAFVIGVCAVLSVALLSYYVFILMKGDER